VPTAYAVSIPIIVPVTAFLSHYAWVRWATPARTWSWRRSLSRRRWR
jgi:hypothetical protein